MKLNLGPAACLKPGRGEGWGRTELVLNLSASCSPGINVLLTETKPELAAATTSTCQCLGASWGILDRLWAGQAVLGKRPKPKGKEVTDREAVSVRAFLVH